VKRSSGKPTHGICEETLHTIHAISNSQPFSLSADGLITASIAAERWPAEG